MYPILVHSQNYVQYTQLVTGANLVYAHFVDTLKFAADETCLAGKQSERFF